MIDDFGRQRMGTTELLNRWIVPLEKGVVYLSRPSARRFKCREADRPFRNCHPRYLMLQVKTYCEFHNQPLVLTSKAIDVAVKNYIAGL